MSDFDLSYGNETVKSVSNMVKDPLMKLYLLFLSYCLKIINELNKEMQSELPKMHFLLSKFKNLFNQIARNFILKKVIDSNPIKSIDLNYTINHLSDNELYCGTEVEKFSMTVVDPSILQEFRCNVRKFYITFCEKLRLKIDFDNEILNLLPKFSPEHVLNGESTSILKLLICLFPDFEVENAEIINIEYRALSDYRELNKFKNYNISEFWNEIGNLKNDLNEYMFKNIYRIAQGILSLPHSSANVERIFSIQNLIKTKCRNRMAVNTCEALIQTKDLIKSKNHNCFDFKIPKYMTQINMNDPKENELLE